MFCYSKDYYQLPRHFHHRIVVFGRSGSGRKTQGLAIAKRFNLVYSNINKHFQFYILLISISQI